SFKLFCLRFVDDETFAQITHKGITGKKLDLINPKTFDEKLWWLKLNDKNPLLTICSDKVMVRNYVKDKIGENILNEIYNIYDNVEEIDIKNLPKNFFLKCNHMSGGNLLCNDKELFDLKSAKRKLKKLLKKNYYYQSREWNYKNIVPQIICEKVLLNNDGSPLIDYRFFCFNKKCKIIVVDINTSDENGIHREDVKRNVYDNRFNLLNVKITRENFDSTLVRKPEKLDIMIEYAEKLAEPFVQCRVDFYYVNNNIYFGEMTFYHASGNNVIFPVEFDSYLGNLIEIP
ncbi:MAG: ATP-grasp fold amidoligase family protein, partial [Anaerovorax sp.]|nr:ATP-grasp fold amidoligase family protein [Anaerovorax sp.]